MRSSQETLIGRILFLYLFDCLKLKAYRLGFNTTQGDFLKCIPGDNSYLSQWKSGKRPMPNAVNIEKLIVFTEADRTEVFKILQGEIPEQYEQKVKMWKMRE